MATSHATAFDQPEREPFPLHDANQAGFIVVYCNGERHRLKTGVPGIFVLGGFPSQALGTKHLVDNCPEINRDFDVFWVPAHQSTPICENLEGQRSPAYCKAVVEEIEELARQAKQASDDAFAAKIDSVNNGTVKPETKELSTPQAQPTNQSRRRLPRKRRPKKPALSAPAAAGQPRRQLTLEVTEKQKLSNQQWVSLMWKPDLRNRDPKEHDPEPLIVLGSAFADLVDAEHYATHTMGPHYKAKVVICKMYSWLHPTLINPKDVKYVYESNKAAEKKSLIQGIADRVHKNSPFELPAGAIPGQAQQQRPQPSEQKGDAADDFPYMAQPDEQEGEDRDPSEVPIEVQLPADWTQPSAGDIAFAAARLGASDFANVVLD